MHPRTPRAVIFSLGCEARRRSKGEGMARDWDAWLGQDDESSLALVGEVRGKVVGWLSARIEPPDEDAEVQLTREHGWTRLAVDALILQKHL
jgi:hypothetical protein